MPVKTDNKSKTLKVHQIPIRCHLFITKRRRKRPKDHFDKATARKATVIPFISHSLALAASSRERLSSR